MRCHRNSMGGELNEVSPEFLDLKNGTSPPTLAAAGVFLNFGRATGYFGASLSTRGVNSRAGSASTRGLYSRFGSASNFGLYSRLASPPNFGWSFWGEGGIIKY